MGWHLRKEPPLLTLADVDLSKIAKARKTKISVKFNAAVTDLRDRKKR